MLLLSLRCAVVTSAIVADAAAVVAVAVAAAVAIAVVVAAVDAVAVVATDVWLLSFLVRLLFS